MSTTTLEMGASRVTNRTSQMVRVLSTTTVISILARMGFC